MIKKIKVPYQKRQPLFKPVKTLFKPSPVVDVEIKSLDNKKKMVVSKNSSLPRKKISKKNIKILNTSKLMNKSLVKNKKRSGDFNLPFKKIVKHDYPLKGVKRSDGFKKSVMKVLKKNSSLSSPRNNSKTKNDLSKPDHQFTTWKI